MYVQTAVAVFTTPERCDMFRAAIGEDADYRLDPYQSLPLDIMLENLHAGGARAIVCDESHFFDIGQLAHGLQAYMDKPQNKGQLLRPIVVCPKRKAGDRWLRFFSSYLGIYDIVYNVSGLDAALAARRLLECANERVDVLRLLGDKPRLDDQAPVDVHTTGNGVECQIAADKGLTINVQVNIEPHQ